MTTIKSTMADYGQYVLVQTTYPSSVAGAWAGTNEKGEKYSATIAAYSINGGAPISITVPSLPSPVTLEGTCNYNEKTGIVSANVAGMTFEIKYDLSANTLVGDITGMGKITFERIASTVK